MITLLPFERMGGWGQDGAEKLGSPSREDAFREPFRALSAVVLSGYGQHPVVRTGRSQTSKSSLETLLVSS
jgi:hypothetical protein